MLHAVCRISFWASQVGSVIICADTDPDFPINKQNYYEKPLFLQFCDFWITFIFEAVFRIRIRKFSGLQDPDPYINKQKFKKKPW
jgi:hypothetical protein